MHAFLQAAAARRSRAPLGDTFLNQSAPAVIAARPSCTGALDASIHSSHHTTLHSIHPSIAAVSCVMLSVVHTRTQCSFSARPTSARVSASGWTAGYICGRMRVRVRDNGVEPAPIRLPYVISPPAFLFFLLLAHLFRPVQLRKRNAISICTRDITSY